MKTYIYKTLGLLLAALAITGCMEAKPEAVGAAEVPEPVAVNVDTVVGTVYNLWDTRIYNAPERWADPKFAKRMQNSSLNIDYMVNVRSLGGKRNHACEWFKGVDAQGKPICDFEPFLGYMQAQLDVGFTPWIVLDNVPWGMVADSKDNRYGQCRPADDYDLWFQYVQQFVQALVDRFGMEEVSQWRFRVGTEPDLFPHHWDGTKEEYLKHYDYTVAAVESVIPEPRVGPGNILMYKSSQLGGKDRWGFDILGHCAVGTNYYSGKTGTRMEWFSQSCYAEMGQRFLFEENMIKYHEELAKYPELKDVVHEIHEYGEIHGIEARADDNRMCEWYAALFAQTVDIAYRYDCRRIFNWSQVMDGMPQPWIKVLDFLNETEGGELVEVIRPTQTETATGAIAVWKEGSLYILAYVHHPAMDSLDVVDLDLNIDGKRLEAHSAWSLEEQLMDKEHGIYYHEMVKDIEAAGIIPKEDSFYYTPVVSMRYASEDHVKVQAVLKANRAKYQRLSELAVVRSDERVELQNGRLQLDLSFEGDGLRFLKISPER